MLEWWIIIPWVLMPEWRPCMSWWENPDVTLLLLLLLHGVLGNVVRIIWRETKADEVCVCVWGGAHSNLTP